LTEKHYPELEGTALALRRALAELDRASPEFVSLIQRQAKRELRHSVACTKARLQYDGLARIANDESRHPFLEEQFAASGSSRLDGVAETAELGIDADCLLSDAGYASS
jgi:hypothetical protein